MAAPPPRALPNNLLFVGPPPTLPRVLLLPSDTPHHNAPLHQTNDKDALCEINNVGVPTYSGVFDSQIRNEVLKTEDAEYQLPRENYLRRTHSFDISDIYTPRFIESQAFRLRRSEPDLTKYGLFVEAEVTVDCAPIEHPQLVLNNPFYDGSYAVDATQLNPTVVMLPENYLSFEDAFVPTWEYKPEYLIDRDLNTGLYYDGLPLIPANDPWSAYCGDNAVYCSNNTEFQYYSQHYETGEHDGINYMPLTDLDYAIPSYMNLPEVEAQVENTNIDLPLYTSQLANLNVASDNSEILEPNESSFVVSNVVSEDEKNSVELMKESSAHSEESLNADISNDVTSSLAFVPDSKSLQMPGVDDTSADTSPCSTDYHEASALDLVQSLDDLSCRDITDYSQSRDELSPVLPPDMQESKAEHNNEAVNSSKPIDESIDTITASSTLPLCQLPSIPIPESVPSPPIPHLEYSNQTATSIVETKADITQSNQINTIAQDGLSKSSDKVETNEKCETKTTQNQTYPHPPAVPPSWLPRKPPTGDKPINAVPSPQIRVQKVESRPAFEKSLKPPSQTKGIPQASEEPQPSCSFVKPQAAPVSQLKLEKQPKEVEVSQHYNNSYIKLREFLLMSKRAKRCQRIGGSTHLF